MQQSCWRPSTGKSSNCQAEVFMPFKYSSSKNPNSNEGIWVGWLFFQASSNTKSPKILPRTGLTKINIVVIFLPRLRLDDNTCDLELYSGECVEPGAGVRAHR